MRVELVHREQCRDRGDRGRQPGPDWIIYAGKLPRSVWC